MLGKLRRRAWTRIAAWTLGIQNNTLKAPSARSRSTQPVTIDTGRASPGFFPPPGHVSLRKHPGQEGIPNDCYC